MIARASQPMQQVRIDVTGQLTFTAMTITALGFSVTGGLVGAVVNTGIAATILAMAVPFVGEGLHALLYAKARSGQITELDLNLDASIEDRTIRQSISIPPGAVTTVGPPHIFTEQDAATSPFDPAPEGGAAKGVEVQLVQNPGDIAAYLILQGSNFLAKTGLGASPDALNLVFQMGDIEVKGGREGFYFGG